MSYVENHLLKDEQICYQAKIHWIIFAVPFFLTIATLILLTMNSILSLLAYICLALATIFWINNTIRYFTSEYAVTSKRVIVKLGFIRRQTVELLLHRVEGIQVSQDILGRLLGYGSLYIIGTGGTRDPINLVSDPISFRNHVQQQVEHAIKTA